VALALTVRSRQREEEAGKASEEGEQGDLEEDEETERFDSKYVPQR
jgi:hypothetical protein